LLDAAISKIMRECHPDDGHKKGAPEGTPFDPGCKPGLIGGNKHSVDHMDHAI